MCLLALTKRFFHFSLRDSAQTLWMNGVRKPAVAKKQAKTTIITKHYCFYD